MSVGKKLNSFDILCRHTTPAYHHYSQHIFRVSVCFIVGHRCSKMWESCPNSMVTLKDKNVFGFQHICFAFFLLFHVCFLVSTLSPSFTVVCVSLPPPPHCCTLCVCALSSTADTQPGCSTTKTQPAPRSPVKPPGCADRYTGSDALGLPTCRTINVVYESAKYHPLCLSHSSTYPVLALWIYWHVGVSTLSLSLSLSLSRYLFFSLCTYRTCIIFTSSIFLSPLSLSLYCFLYLSHLLSLFTIYFHSPLSSLIPSSQSLCMYSRKSNIDYPYLQPWSSILHVV